MIILRLFVVIINSALFVLCGVMAVFIHPLIAIGCVTAIMGMVIGARLGLKK